MMPQTPNYYMLMLCIEGEKGCSVENGPSDSNPGPTTETT